MNFPSTLPEPLIAGYGIEPQPGALRTDITPGPAHARRRSAARIMDSRVSWTLDAAQMEAFKAFYEVDLSDGMSWFSTVLDFGNGNSSCDCRFVNPYAARPLGGGIWAVSAQLEARDIVLLEVVPPVDPPVDPPYSPSLDFSDERNSQYLGAGF